MSQAAKLRRQTLVPASMPRRPAVDLDTLIRSVLFVAVFLAVWISFHPFQSLSLTAAWQVTEGGDVANQIGFSTMFLRWRPGLCCHEPPRLMLLLRPALIARAGLVRAVASLASWEPALAARRLAFTLVIMSIAGMTLLLPKNLRHFAT